MSKRTGGRLAPLAPQMRLTARPEEILTKSPLLQAVAQMETGWEGERGAKPSRWYWFECPNLRPVTGSVDLTGQVWGRLTVVGLLDKWKSGTGGSWVVRCACGRYETRKAKAIERKAHPHESCTSCDYVRHLRRREVFDRTGKWPENFPA